MATLKHRKSVFIIILFLFVILIGYTHFNPPDYHSAPSREERGTFNQNPLIKALDKSQTVNHSLDTNQTINAIGLDQDNLGIKGNSETVVDFLVDNENSIINAGTIEVEYGYRGTAAFISKVSSAGELIWNKTIDGVIMPRQIISDKNNNILMIGMVLETETTIVPPSNAINTSVNGWFDIVLIKFNREGDIIWSTFWGGALQDFPGGIAIDQDENIIITGSTMSTDFPTTDGAAKSIKENVGLDLFITKFTNDGQLIFSTYFGGVGYEKDPYLQIDSQNNIIIVSDTKELNFPTSPNAYQSSSSGNNEIILFKLDPFGDVIFSTYLGGSGSDTYSSITIDNFDNIYLTGTTFSLDFPIINASSSTIQGIVDSFIVKFNPNGELLVSTYFGYNNVDEVGSIYLTEDNEILITGYTKSDDLPTTSNSYQADISGQEDAFIALMDTAINTKWITYLGGQENDEGVTIKVDLNGDIIVLGITNSENFPIYKGYNYTFGGLDGFISKFSISGDVIWVSRTTIVTDPGLDFDGDLLTNSEEFRLKTNPLSPDTDSDGMMDNWEHENGLNPLVKDHNEDPDQDGFTNKQEFQLLTDPFNSDTDGDLMDDRWEFLNQLDPLDSSDFDSDEDGDGMHALWEYRNNMDPLLDDGSFDFDNDGLTNFEEWNYTRVYSLGLDPNNRDTDGDSMDDGWEIKNQLDPLNSADVKFDPDNDFLNNGIEYKYRRLGMDPNSNNDLYILLMFLFIYLFSMIWVVQKLRKTRNQAISQGFSGYIEQFVAKRRGFLSSASQSKALEHGFLNKEIFDVVLATGHENAKQLFSNFQSESAKVELILLNTGIESLIQEISSATSPRNVDEIQSKYADIIENLNNYKLQLTGSIALQDSLLKILRRSGKMLLVDYNQEDIEKERETTIQLVDKLEHQLNSISKSIHEKLEWFVPWTSLLQLIKVTEAKVPLTIQEIMEVINRSESHCEELLILLLKENRLIGSYDIEKKIYVKDTRFDQYIDDLLEILLDDDIDDEVYDSIKNRLERD